VKWINLVEKRVQWRDCEDSNGTTGSIKCMEFLDQLSDYQLANKNPGAWSLLMQLFMAASRLASIFIPFCSEVWGIIHNIKHPLHQCNPISCKTFS